MKIEKSTNIRQKLQKSLNFRKPVICRVRVSERQVTAPWVTSRQTEDGSMETAPMEEMWPEIIQDKH